MRSLPACSWCDEDNCVSFVCKKCQADYKAWRLFVFKSYLRAVWRGLVALLAFLVWAFLIYLMFSLI